MKDKKKSPLRIVIGIIIAVILIASGLKELKSSVSELGTSVENLKEDINEMKEGN